MSVIIYSLSDPRTDEIRYVGKTSISLEKRYKNHLKDCFRNKFYSAFWIKSLLLNNIYPKIEILDIVEIDNWEFWEIYWINQCKQWGFKLTNISDGGLSDNKYFNNYICQNRKVIDVYDLNGKYLQSLPSVIACSNFYKLDNSSIHKCCKGKSWSCKEYLFRYNTDLDKRLIKPNRKGFKKLIVTKKLILEFIELLKKGHSYKEVASKYNLSLHTVNKRVSDYCKVNKIKIKDFIIEIYKDNIKIDVKKTIKEIEESYKIPKSNIHASIYRGVSAYGYKFKKLEI